MVLNAIGYPKPLTVTGYTSDFFGKNEMYMKPDRDHTAKENAERFSVDDFAAAFVRLEGGIIRAQARARRSSPHPGRSEPSSRTGSCRT